MMHPQSWLISCVALATFPLVVWAGYAILHLLGHGHSRWGPALFAGPTFTIAIWTITLSGAAWASIPLHFISPALWGATLLLAAVGLRLWWTTRRTIETDPTVRPAFGPALWASAAIIPLLVMPASFHYGFASFVNSAKPDAWSYVMVADYLSAVARGADGGLSPLHQYAAHLMGARNGSSSILAHLAIGLGHVQADQAMTLFCLLLLFVNAGALIAFARTVFGRNDAALYLVFLAGIGWPTNIILSGNFDHLLLLPFLPLSAALAERVARGVTLIGASLLIAVLAAASLYAYVELVFVGLTISLAFVIGPGIAVSTSLKRLTLFVIIVIPIAGFLVWPGFASLMQMLVAQLAAASSADRPGLGYFPGLTSPVLFPAAVFALGGEFLTSRWIVLPFAVGACLVVAMLAGVWAERRRWPVVMGWVAVMVGYGAFAYHQKYDYGAYKIISVNFWLVSFLIVRGILNFSQEIDHALPRRATTAALIMAMIAIVTVDRLFVQLRVTAYSENARRQIAYSESRLIADMINNQPTLLAVRDQGANQWAVFYARNTPLLVAPYRSYMAQPHVLPYMQRSKAVPVEEIRFIITDRNDDTRAPLSGARKIWDGQLYSLWAVDNTHWIVIAGSDGFADSDPSSLVPDQKREIQIVAGQRGIVSFNGGIDRIIPPSYRNSVAVVTHTATSYRQNLNDTTVREPIEIAAGKSTLVFSVHELDDGRHLPDHLKQVRFAIQDGNIEFRSLK